MKEDRQAFGVMLRMEKMNLEEAGVLVPCYISAIKRSISRFDSWTKSIKSDLSKFI